MEARSQTQRVVDRFATRHRMRDITGHTDYTVQNWMRSGTIPEKYWLGILLAARREGVPLTPYDFVAHTADALVECVSLEVGASTSGESSASSALPA